MAGYRWENPHQTSVIAEAEGVVMIYPRPPGSTPSAEILELYRRIDEGELVPDPYRAPTGPPEAPLDERITSAPDTLFGGPTLGDVFNA
jgi:hypothetical protein